jgi:hypothetical protein
VDRTVGKWKPGYVIEVDHTDIVNGDRHLLHRFEGPASTQFLASRSAARQSYGARERCRMTLGNHVDLGKDFSILQGNLDDIRSEQGRATVNDNLLISAKDIISGWLISIWLSGQ